MSRDNKRINEEIKASRIRLITETGEQLGEISFEEALKKAEESSMDLVEISNQNGVVLAKIMDYGKFLFKQQKNITKSKQSSKSKELKTIRLTYKIGDHDLEIRRNQALKFAKEGHPLKVELRLKGRENQYAAQASQKINEFVTTLEEFYKIDGRVNKAGNTFNVILHLKK